MLISGQPRVPTDNRTCAVCLLTPTGSILTCNTTMLSLMRKPAAEIVEKPCQQVFGCSPEAQESCPLARTVQSRQQESARVIRDGRKLYETTEPLFDGSGTLWAVVLQVSTSPMAAPDTSGLVRLERLAAIAQATSGVVHDYNNVFAGLEGAVFLLKDKPLIKTNPECRMLLEIIEASLEQGKKLTEQLLEYGKGHEPDKVPLVLDEVIRRAVAFASIGQGVRPTVEIEGGLWRVKANAGQMMQVISNLTINAIHAAGRGKGVWVTAGNLPAGAPRDAGLGDGRYVRIAVRDEGCGIAPDHLGHLFEPFFTTKKHGTGLGLATAGLIVKDHHGHIGVESEVGRTTTFTVHLPALEPTAAGLC